MPFQQFIEPSDDIVFLPVGLFDIPDLSKDLTMISYEEERFVDNLDQLKQSYIDVARRCAVYETALEAVDTWAVPAIDGTDGQFQYIPYQIGSLVDAITELAMLLPDDPDFKHSHQPLRPMSFVEIGCGIGRNLNLVKHQALLPLVKAVGFDIVPEYIETAQRIFGLGEDVFVQDAMTFTYSGFDLIFFYRPFSDDALEAAFEDYLMDNAKPGAIIIGANTEIMHNSRKVAPIGEAGTLFKKL